MDKPKTNENLWNELENSQPLSPVMIEDIANKYGYSWKYINSLANKFFKTMSAKELFDECKDVIINAYDNKQIKCLEKLAKQIGIKPKTLSKFISKYLGEKYLKYVLPETAIKIIILNKNKARYGIKTQEDISKYLNVSLSYIRRVLYTGR